MTNWHTFLRADDLCNLTEEEKNFLLDYGMISIVDLRSKEEIIANPNPFREDDRVAYVNIPLMVNSVDDVTKSLTETFTENPGQYLTRFYLDMVQKPNPAIKEIFTFFAAHADGCTLYHCAAGKDRTGIISMLLLGLAGADKFDIISNYEVTYSNLRKNAAFQAGAKGYPPEVLYSKADYIEPVIDHIYTMHGDFEKFLAAMDIPEAVITAVKKRLTGC